VKINRVRSKVVARPQTVDEPDSASIDALNDKAPWTSESNVLIKPGGDEISSDIAAK